jgi:3-oxoacyl-[acyl-carrier-protein] synthase-3
MILSGIHDRAMVFGAETLSTITNYEDRTSCILFGDGAGAVILEAEENSDRGILYSSLHADGTNWDTLSCRAYGSRNPIGKPLANPTEIYMSIRGRETYQLAVRRIVELIEETYQVCGLSNDDISMVIPHQMNARIIESVVKRLKISSDKMFVNIDKYGNTSAASIAIALDEALRNNHLEKGELIILVSFGAGLTWGVNLIRL